MIDRALLAKILAHLGDAEDAVVLTSARKAAKMVRDAAMTWQDVLVGGSPVRPVAPINEGVFDKGFQDFMKDAVERMGRGLGEGLAGKKRRR